MTRHKITLFPTVWVLLTLLIAATCLSPPEAPAQMCMREELARQSLMRQEVLALQNQERARQMVEHQQVLQFQREEQARQAFQFQQMLQAAHEERMRQLYEARMSRSCR